jgi:predicted methyltransferase
MKNWFIAAVMLLGLSSPALADDALKASLAGPQRTPANAARDAWRHPYETLTFFGIRPDMTVVELSPGGGWYTEVLAPYLRDRGRLILAGADPESSEAYDRRSAERLKAKLQAQASVYDKAQMTVFAPPSKPRLPPANRLLALSPPRPRPPGSRQTSKPSRRSPCPIPPRTSTTRFSAHLIN